MISVPAYRTAYPLSDEGGAMSSRPESDVADRLAVEETLYRYWSRVDAMDYPAVRELFTDDARGRYWGGEWLEGGDVIVEWLANTSAPTKMMHHMGKVYRVDIDGDRATAASYLTAHITAAADPDAVFVSVGTYIDELRRRDGVWSISLKDFRRCWAEQRRADQAALLG